MKQIKLKVNHLKPHSSISYITQYLNNLGITSVSSFINQPQDNDALDPFKLINMRNAVKVAYEILNKNSKIFIQVDSDVDGWSSASILINYIKRRFPFTRIIWKLHAGKEHGINLDTIPDDVNLVFIPDAGSNQFQEQKALYERGIKTIILDHHEISNLSEFQWTPSIIVNNQVSEDFPNKYLSGAGVVYKFIQAMDEIYFTNNTIYRDYTDLAAIGIIADAMNMTTLDNNYIAFWGLSHIHNKFIHELAIKQQRGIKNPNNLTKIDVAFYIAPVINGLIRSGSQEDKEFAFGALINNEDSTLYEHTWRGTTKKETLWERATRLAMNSKSRQDAAKKKSFDWLCDKIRNEGIDKHNIIIVALDEEESTKVSANITGLIAMELVKEFNKPTLVLRKTEFNGQSVYGGSGRNGNFYGLPDLKSMLLKSGCLYGEGHANAFGAFVLPEQIETIRQYFDTHLNAKVFDDVVYEVDYWFHTGEPIDEQMLLEMASYDNLWGNSIPQPKFAIDLNYSSRDIKVMGADSSSLKISTDKVDFVAFKCKDLINELQQQESGHITIIGRPQINEWNGKKRLQMMIDDIDVFNNQETDSALDLI